MIKKINYLVTTLSNLNISNFSVQWWAFNFTSKNPLSSNIYEKIIFEKKYSNDKYFKGLFLFNYLINIIKSFFLLFQSFTFYLTLKKTNLKNKIYIFSYVDGRSRARGDTYFSDLIDQINKSDLVNKASYLFYVYRPYFKNNISLSDEKNNYINIFSYLKVIDFVWCYFYLLKIPFIKVKYQRINERYYNNFKKILYSHMISEMTKGYLDNLLIYRSFKRLANDSRIERLIYPFENKSLEKLVLIAIDGKIKTTGYQHSSITPRHFSFHLSNDERKINPLPDKIVTLGNITKNWLIRKGNIPENKIKTGVYLRGINKIKKKKSLSEKKTKLLFVFSSSFTEIKNTVDFIKNDIKHLDKFKKKFRFHSDFPFSKLNQDYKNWINLNIDSISNKNLIDELEWCDILIYISSSVAIEAISSKIPVINLDIDYYNSDPLLNKKLGLKRVVSNIEEFKFAIKEFSLLSESSKNKYFNNSMKYINQYVINKSKLNVKTFL